MPVIDTLTGDLMAAPHQSVVCADLTFSWPDGTAVLDHLDVTFGAGRSGLIGRNGDGKSTLLRLIAGELSPSGGSITTAAEVAYLPQHLPLRTARTVADLLGITPVRDALAAITAGDADPRHFTAVGDDWDVEARAEEALARLRVLPGAAGALDRPVGTLSGGEAMLCGVAGLLLRRAGISLLDEPTNNLDAQARAALYDAVASWPGVLIVVSHDRELLERTDRIVELRGGSTRTFGGPFSTYVETLTAEQETAARLVRTAEGQVAREKRQYIETQVKLARRLRAANKAEREKRVPKIVANGLKRQAQVSAGKYRLQQAGKLQEARSALVDAEQALRDDDRIRVDLPATAVPSGRTVLRVGELIVRGPERIALVGANGSGKTTLLEAVVGRRRHPDETVAAAIAAPDVPVAYLPQRLDLLDDAPQRPRQRPGGRAERDAARDPGAAGPVPGAGRPGRAAGGHAVRRRAVPGQPGLPAAGRAAAPVAVAGRADEQPRPRQRRAADRRARRLPRRARRREPRPALPGRPRRPPPVGGAGNVVAGRAGRFGMIAG